MPGKKKISHVNTIVEKYGSMYCQEGVVTRLVSWVGRSCLNGVDVANSFSIGQVCELFSKSTTFDQFSMFAFAFSATFVVNRLAVVAFL